MQAQTETISDTHSNELIQIATRNVRDIVTIALEHKAPHKALVIFDTENGLTNILTEAYRTALPDGEFIDFNTTSKEEIIKKMDALAPKDLVVLIQSTDFRLNEFRIRIHLFQHGLKVIDHLHLYRNTPDSWITYINALAYDPTWFRGVGQRLKTALLNTETLKLEGPGTTLAILNGVEEPKLNIGDYTGMTNIGGTFPIGEVFTEAKDLSQVNGSLMIYGFAGQDFLMNMYEPFRIDIENGIVVSWADNAPKSFGEIVALVKQNERPLIREIGFGLNRAITREHYLKDITAFERILGLHVSMGEKHSVYKKAGIVIDKTRYHVDLFPVIDRVTADGTVIFENNSIVV